MPSDVPLGAGYIGDALFTRFPGQYRDAEQEAAGRGFFDFPGNHRPMYRDPDNGKQMTVQEIPGVGQVVVPVEHSMAAVVPVDHTIAAVYPSDHYMAGVDDMGDDPRTPHGKMHWHAKLVAALDASANMANAPAQLQTAFQAVAQIAVEKALQKAKRCKFKSPEEGVAFVKASILASAKNFKPMVQQVAALVADGTSKAVASALKSAWCAPGSKPKAVRMGRKGKKLGDWPGSMMGMNGIADSIANVAAGSDLDAMARNISKLADALIAAYNQVTSLQQQENAATVALSAAGVANVAGGVSSLFGGAKSSADDSLTVNALSALKSVNEGYKALTGFDYMTQVLANVFAPNASKLDSVYSGITAILGQIKNWNDTWQKQIGDSHPDMVQLWDAIQNEHNRLWAQAKKGPFNFDDPSYLTTASQAVQNLTGVTEADASGMGDFGVSALIACIVIAIAAVAIAIAIVKVANSFNTVANNIADQRKQYEATMSKQHDDYIAQRVSEGADVQTAEQEWLDLKSKYDAAEAEKEKGMAANSPSAADFGKYIAYGAAAIGVAVGLPHLLKALGVSL